MTPEGLTDSWLSAVLHTEVKVGDTRRIGDGLVGMNIRLELASDGSIPASLIAKLPSPDPTSRATGIALRNYEREVCFYLEIAPTVDIRVARCYHAELHADSGDFVLLMEDLSPAQQALAGYGIAVDGEQLWLQYRRDAYAGAVMSVIASQIVGASDRSEAMFAAMATRHAQHVLDLESESLL